MHIKIIVANYPSVYTCYTQREMPNSFVDIPNNSPKKFNLILFANIFQMSGIGLEGILWILKLNRKYN